MDQIEIHLLGSLGADVHTMTTDNAPDFIHDQMANHAKWLYLDGQQTCLEEITSDKLLKTAQIVMMSQQLGGS